MFLYVIWLVGWLVLKLLVTVSYDDISHPHVGMYRYDMFAQRVQFLAVPGK